MLDGEEMNLGAYNVYRGWKIPENEDPAREGYLVKYDNEYESWSPKEVFEKYYLELAEDKPNSISPSDIDGFLLKSESEKFNENTVMTTVTLRNGTKLYEPGSCVDPANFDMAIGQQIGEKRAKEKVWPLLGFVLAWAKNGLNRDAFQGILK